MAGPPPAKLSSAAFNAKFNQQFNQRFNAAHAGRVAPPRPVQSSAASPNGSALAAYLNPGQPLSGQSLLNAATALADAQTQPTIQGLKGQIGANDQQTHNALGTVGGYYNQLGDLAKQGAAGEGTVANDLRTQLAGNAASGQTALQGIGDNATSMLQRYAPPSTPGDLSQSSPALQALTSEIARQRGLAAQNSTAFQNYGATQGANYRGLGESQLGTTALAGQEGLRSIAQAGLVKNEPLDSRLAAAIGGRGALISTDVGKLRQQEINNEISRAGLGIRQESAQASLQNAAAHTTTAAAAARNAGTNAGKAAFENNPGAVGSTAWQRQQSVSNKNWSTNPNAVGSPAWGRVQAANRAASKAKGAGGPKPLSTAENNVWFQNLGRVEQLIKDGNAHGGNEQQIRAALQDGSNPSKKSFDPTMIQAAYELVGYGALQPNTAQALQKSMGLRVPQTIKVANPPTTIQGAGNLALGALSGF